MSDPCSDCPPGGYPTDETRCLECPLLAQAKNGIIEAEAEKELYRSRWLSCVTPEEAQRLRDRLAEADAVIAYAMFDEFIQKDKVNRWADESLERHRERQQEREDNGQFGLGA